MEYSDAFVCLMGVGIVFVGLIFIIFFTWLMSKICMALGKGEKEEATAPSTPAAVSDEIPNRPEFIAAVSAAIAEEMGTDISAIRIHSVKRI